MHSERIPRCLQRG